MLFVAPFVPAVPVTVRFIIVAGGAGLRAPQAIAPASKNARNSRCLVFRFRPTVIATMPARRNDRLFNAPGLRDADAVLETVTVRGTDVFVVLRVAGLGLTEQVAPAGAPVQASVTCPVKPAAAVSVTLKVAVSPGLMLCDGESLVRLNGAFTATVAGAEMAGL